MPRPGAAAETAANQRFRWQGRFAMNQNSASLRTATVVTVLGIVAATLLFLGVHWLSRSGSETASAAPAGARPQDPADVRASAEQAAESARESLALRAAVGDPPPVESAGVIDPGRWTGAASVRRRASLGRSAGRRERPRRSSFVPRIRK